MGFDFDDAVHVMGLDDLLRTDDDAPPDSYDYTDPGSDDNGHMFQVVIAWDGEPADAKWYASSIAALCRKHVPGCVVTFTDAAL